MAIGIGLNLYCQSFKFHLAQQNEKLIYTIEIFFSRQLNTEKTVAGWHTAKLE